MNALQIDDNTVLLKKKDVIENFHALFYSFKVVFVLWVGGRGGCWIFVFFPSNLHFKNYPGDYKSPSDAELPMA